MHLGLMTYWPSTINTDAFGPFAFGSPIYGKIVLWPHCIWVHILSTNAVGPDSILAEYF